MLRFSVPLRAALLGLLLALTLPPLPTGVLAPLVLAALLYFAAQAATPRELAGRMFWATTAMMAVHLSWLMAFVGKLVGAAPLGVLAFLLYALEGGFFALMAYLVGRLLPRSGWVWGLAGGWVGLEALRFIGPFAFPWPTLGYALLPTPMIQIADLGGVLLGSVLVTFTAAALVSFWHGKAAPLWVAAAVWVAALAYGVTRVPGEGATGQALLIRSTIDTFAKANDFLSPQQQFDRYAALSQQRHSGEVVVWSETAIQDPAMLNQAPPDGIYGVAGYREAPKNLAVAWTGQQMTAQNDKARPVPFGEYFPLRNELAPFWTQIENITHLSLESLPAAKTLTPLPLNGVQYGAYVCYDSVFPWVARQLTNKGANVLVNISNDGWYAGWGVAQHFAMGRVRAIENRRWVLRSVNEGIAGSVDDLGRPRRTLNRGEGALHAEYKALTGRTVYNQLGDWPALLLALGMVGAGCWSRKST